jgi:hypothetical protein
MMGEAKHTTETRGVAASGVANKLFRYDPDVTSPTTVAQWTGPGEAGSKIFPNFQTANDFFLNDISNLMTFLFIDIIH